MMAPIWELKVKEVQRQLLRLLVGVTWWMVAPFLKVGNAGGRIDRKGGVPVERWSLFCTI